MDSLVVHYSTNNNKEIYKQNEDDVTTTTIPRKQSHHRGLVRRRTNHHGASWLWTLGMGLSLWCGVVGVNANANANATATANANTVKAQGTNGNVDVEVDGCVALSPSKKLSFTQLEAPRDISGLLMIVVEQVNLATAASSDESVARGVVDVDVEWTGGDLAKAEVGTHRVVATVQFDHDKDRKKIKNGKDGDHDHVAKCYTLDFEVRDTDECAENIHGCVEPAYCVNTLGSYECACPRITEGTRLTTTTTTTTPLPRGPWERSVPVDGCPSVGSTADLVHVDADRELLDVDVDVDRCRSLFRCPVDPCGSVQNSSSSSSSSEPPKCVVGASCVRGPTPVHGHSCECPPGTVGNGRPCPFGETPSPPRVASLDHVFPTAAAGSRTPTGEYHRRCGCTVPVVDPCVGVVCGTRRTCVLSPKDVVDDDDDDDDEGEKKGEQQPQCVCRPGYVEVDGDCVDETPPVLIRRCDDGSGVTVVRRGQVYNECAVDVLDDDADNDKDYARGLRIAYSRPVSPGKCLTSLESFVVTYTVHSSRWTAATTRTVRVEDVDVCAYNSFSSSQPLCEEVLPQCVPEATCQAHRGGYTCKCPPGTDGDGSLDGTGCVDRTPPVMRWSFAGETSPKIFRVCRCDHLGGNGGGGLFDRRDNDDDNNNDNNNNNSLEQRIKRYEQDLEWSIRNNGGADLCPTPSCVVATDTRHDGTTVDLTDRVVVGAPERMVSSDHPPSTIRFRVPFRVTDDAGNHAKVLYREVEIIETNPDALETLLHDEERARIDAERRLKETEALLQQERERHQKQQRTQTNTTPSPKCPQTKMPKACPVCPTLHNDPQTDHQTNNHHDNAPRFSFSFQDVMPVVLSVVLGILALRILRPAGNDERDSRNDNDPLIITTAPTSNGPKLSTSPNDSIYADDGNVNYYSNNNNNNDTQSQNHSYGNANGNGNHNDTPSFTVTPNANGNGDRSMPPPPSWFKRESSRPVNMTTPSPYRTIDDMDVHMHMNDNMSPITPSRSTDYKTLQANNMRGG